MINQELWCRDFRLLFVSRTLKVLADNFTWMALIWFMLDLGGGAVSSSVLNLASMVPMMLLGMFVGPMLTRGSLTRRMFESDAVRAMMVMTVPICSWMHALPIWLFYVVAFVQSSCGSIYNPASVALLPLILDKSVLQKANAFLESSNQIMRLVSLAGAGAMITWVSPSVTLALTSGLFLLSALVLLLIRLPESDGRSGSEEEETEKTPYWAQIRSGLAILRKHRILFVINGYCIFLNIGIMPYDSLITAYVHDTLKLSAFDMTSLRIFGILGAISVGFLLARIHVNRNGLLFISAGILQGLMLILLSQFSTIWMISIVSLVIGASITAINVPEMVLIQSLVPQRQQATVYSVGTAISTMFMPLSGVAVVMLSRTYSVGAIIGLGGGLILASGIALCFFLPKTPLQSSSQQASA